jgi:uncharacterized membrane protein YedE/YeeE
MSMLDELAPGLLSSSLPPFPVDSAQLDAAAGTTNLVATLTGLLVESIYYGLLSLLLLMVLRVVLRRQWPAVLAYVLVTGVIATLPGSHPGTAWLTLGLGVAVTGAYALIRFGLLTLITGLLVDALLLAYPVTTDLDAWFAGAGLFAVVIAAVAAVIGYWFSLARRSLIPEPPAHSHARAA